MIINEMNVMHLERRICSRLGLHFLECYFF